MRRCGARLAAWVRWLQARLGERVLGAGVEVPPVVAHYARPLAVEPEAAMATLAVFDTPSPLRTGARSNVRSCGRRRDGTWGGTHHSVVAAVKRAALEVGMYVAVMRAI